MANEPASGVKRRFDLDEAKTEAPKVDPVAEKAQTLLAEKAKEAERKRQERELAGMLHAELEAQAAQIRAQKQTVVDEEQAVVMRAPEHAAPINLGGRLHEIDKDGMVRVPPRYVRELEAHGYKLPG